MKKDLKARKIVTVAVLGALATVILALKVPVPFAPSIYKLDASEAVVLIGGFVLGPVAAVGIEAIKVLMNFLIDGTVTAGIGELANFLMGCAFVAPACIIYKKNKSVKSAVIGAAVGIVSLSVVACLLNAFVLLPAYSAAFGMPLDAIIAMGTKVNGSAVNLTGFIMYITLPFNLLKGAISAVLALLIYKKAAAVLSKFVF